MYLLKRKVRPMLGIDISTTTVKLLELVRSGNWLRVDSYAVEPLPPTAVVDKTIAEVAVVGAAIERAVRRSRTKNTTAAVAVSGSSVITKIVNMQAGLSDAELEVQLEVDADQHIPFPLDEVAIDFEVLGESLEDTDMMEVVLAASRTEVVDNCVAALDVAGLTAKVVDVEAFALNNVIGMMMEDGLVGSDDDDDEEETIAIADIGSSAFTFSVIQDMVTIYSRSQPFGGAQLTERIQHQYGISYEDAGIAKKRGGLPSNYGPEVLEPFKEEMVQQIERAQQFFFSSSTANRVDHLVLAGGCASIPGMAKLAGDRLSVQTTIANPFANMKASSRVDGNRLLKEAPTMLIAAGLSLRGVA